MRFFSFLLIHSVHLMWILSKACFPLLRLSTGSSGISSADVYVVVDVGADIGICVDACVCGSGGVSTDICVDGSVGVFTNACIVGSVSTCVDGSVDASVGAFVSASVDRNRGLTNFLSFGDTS